MPTIPECAPRRRPAPSQGNARGARAAMPGAQELLLALRPETGALVLPPLLRETAPPRQRVASRLGRVPEVETPGEGPCRRDVAESGLLVPVQHREREASPSAGVVLLEPITIDPLEPGIAAHAFLHG